MDLPTIVSKYAGQGVLIDTNILLLLLIGSLDRALIPIYKRTRQFVVEDYDTLTSFLDNFSILRTTPNVLTEVSNLAGQLGGRKEAFYRDVFTKSIQVLEETYIESKIAINEPVFSKVGLTDSAIICLAKRKYLLLTDDFELSQRFQHLGGDAINFNHIRTKRWQVDS